MRPLRYALDPVPRQPRCGLAAFACGVLLAAMVLFWMRIEGWVP